MMSSFDSAALFLEDWARLPQKSLSTILYTVSSLLPTTPRSHHEPRPTGRTAYLDGIRGQAALGVAILHMVLGFFSAANFGYNGQPGRDFIFQMPIVRLLYTGQPTLFFFISGYVISIGTLKKIRSRSYGRLQLDLSSKIFRRGFRLYIPAVGATILPMVMTYFNLFPGVAQFTEDLPHFTMNLPAPEPTLARHFIAWFWTIPPLLWTFDWANYSTTSPWAYQLWTVPVEFRCSILVFLLLSAFSRCTTRARLALMSTIALLWLTYEKWDVFLFMAGAIFAEIDLIKQEFNARLPPPPLNVNSERFHNDNSNTSACTTACLWSIIFIALWILSVPADEIWNTWSFPILEDYAPLTYTSKIFRFWDSIGSVMLLGATTCLPSIQRFFSHPFWLYMGRISFSLYLTHTICLKAIMYPMVPYALAVTGGYTQARFTTGVLFCAVVYLLVALWVADMFQRYVEQPSAKLTLWVDERLSQNIDDKDTAPTVFKQ